MKTKTIIGILGIITYVALAQDKVPSMQSVLSWDDPNAPGTIASYKVYEIISGTNVLLSTVVSNQWTIALNPGLHTVFVTAVGTNGVEAAASTNKTFSLICPVLNLKVTP